MAVQLQPLTTKKFYYSLKKEVFNLKEEEGHQLLLQ